MAEKRSFIFYFDWAEAFEDLSDEEVGQLTRALVKFAASGERTIFRSRAMKILFKLLTGDILRDAEKYEDVIEKRRESGKKGGLATASKTKQKVANEANAAFAEQKVAKGSKRKQSQANQADNVNVNDNVNDNDNDNEGEGVNIVGSPSQEEVVSFFQEEGFSSSPAVFWNYYEARGWRINGDPVHNWHSLARNWEEREFKKPPDTEGYTYNREVANYD